MRTNGIRNSRPSRGPRSWWWKALRWGDQNRLHLGRPKHLELPILPTPNLVGSTLTVHERAAAVVAVDVVVAAVGDVVATWWVVAARVVECDAAVVLSELVCCCCCYCCSVCCCLYCCSSGQPLTLKTTTTMSKFVTFVAALVAAAAVVVAAAAVVSNIVQLCEVMDSVGSDSLAAKTRFEDWRCCSTEARAAAAAQAVGWLVAAEWWVRCDAGKARESRGQEAEGRERPFGCCLSCETEAANFASAEVEVSCTTT